MGSILRLIVAVVLYFVENALLPDFLVRILIRYLVTGRFNEHLSWGAEGTRQHEESFIRELRQSPIAICTTDANLQHYEVPPLYFLLTLGPRLKYSGCLYPESLPLTRDGLRQAEERSLAVYCGRAEIADGMNVLDLGCGWGSLSLFILERYPNARVTAISNSAPQRQVIVERAQQAAVADRLRVLTRNVADMTADSLERGVFDRVVSIEMFEHMKNYHALLSNISAWMKPDTGKLFVQIFTFRHHSYHFEHDDADADAGNVNWMAKHFFSGGTMPHEHLLARFQDDLRLVEHWMQNGSHYSRTLECWLRLMDAHRGEILRLFEQAYASSSHSAAIWFQRWRLFHIACSELFRYKGGEEWFVSHYLFEQRATVH